jgi:imidazolonepropionase-like amidohydrolase
MLESATWLCPTLAVSKHIHIHGHERGLPAAALAKKEVVRTSRVESAGAAAAAGVRIFLGTDTSGVLPFGRHAWELELLVSLLGVAPMRALQMATREAAEGIGLGARCAVLHAGSWGDVIVVEGDPLSDVRVLQSPERVLGVFRDGRLLVDRGLSSLSPA